MRKKSVFRIFYLIFIALMGYFLITRFDLKSSLEVVLNITPYIFVYIFMVFLVVFFVNLRFKIILASKGINVKMTDLFFYKFSEIFVNYVTPAAFLGGEPLKAYLISKKYKKKASKCLSSAIIDKSLDLLVNLFLAFISFIYIIFEMTGSLKQGFLFIAAAIFIFGFTILFLFFRSYLKGKPFFKIFFRFLKRSKYKKLRDAFDFLVDFEDHLIFFFRRRRKAFLKAIFVTLFISVLMYFEYFFMLKSLGIVETRLFFPLVVLSMVGFSYLIPVPAAIGSLELLQSLAFKMYGKSVELSLAFVILLRLKDFIMAFLGMLYLFFRKINPKEISEKEIKEDI